MNKKFHSRTLWAGYLVERGSLRCFAQWFRGGQLIYQEKPLKKLPLMTVHSGQLGLLTAKIPANDPPREIPNSPVNSAAS